MSGMIAEDLPRWLQDLSPRLIEHEIITRPFNHALINEYEPAKVVVGNPVALSGWSGPSADAVRRFVSDLSLEVDVEIVLQDERFSTVEASRRLREANMSEKAQRQVIDAAAAAVILQQYLDGRQS